MRHDQVMTDVALIRTATGLIGALISAVNGNWQKAADDRRVLRRTSAEELYSAADALQRAVQKASPVSDPVALAGAIEAFYRAWAHVERSCPPQWRHVGRSVRDCVGEALGGVASADHRTICEHEQINFDYMWAQYASDYLDLIRDRVNLWRDPYRTRKAMKVTIPSYHEWLSRSERWPLPPVDFHAPRV